MHILFVTYEFVTEKRICGGLGHYLANISSILAGKGHRVTILLISNHNAVFEWKNNIKVVAFKYNHAGAKNKIGNYIEYFTKVNISVNLNRSMAIRDKIKEVNSKCPIDIVQYCGDSLLVWYRIADIPSVVRMSSFGPWYAMAKQLGTNMEDFSWLNTWESKLLLYSLSKADAIYSPSNFVAEIVKGKLKREVRVIESPCVVNRSENAENIDSGLQGKEYLLFYGRISILKGFGVLKEAIHEILKRNPHILFVFAGGEEKKNMMQSMKMAAGEYQDRVLYLGEIKDPAMLYSIVKGAFACVLPSRADNLPNTCIEAMGLGKIVIGTYGASFEQLIRNKENGLLIKRDSSEALIAAIDYLMRMTEEEHSQMEKNAKKRVARMSPDKIYEQLIAFYNEVIEKKKKKLFRKGFKR